MMRCAKENDVANALQEISPFDDPRWAMINALYFSMKKYRSMVSGRTFFKIMPTRL